MTPLTPTELIKDIKSLNRIEHDWLQEGRLDAITEEDITDKRMELMLDLRERFTTGQNENFIGHGDSWFAHEGDMDCDLIGNVYVPVIPVAYGNTELEAIETLLELIGEK